MSSFSFKVAYRYLLTKRKEAFISIISIVSLIGIAIGVGVLNIVMAIMKTGNYFINVMTIMAELMRSFQPIK